MESPHVAGESGGQPKHSPPAESHATGAGTGVLDPVRKSGLGVLPACLLTGGILSAAILFWFDPSRYHFYPTCLFYRTTGLLCPGCGSLRALHQLLHGDLATAFRFNPLLVLALPGLAWLAVRVLIRSWRVQPSGVSLSRTWVLIFLGVTLVFSIWRNLPGSVFAALPH